ncbi:DUF5941 domain-containing protein [Actinoplanes sp. NPDC051851]|uniref:DUF5941 domain-containing protein n=1 Tax=Actinoplanes sp. NPDC051851 TaxID=3154753 RepID=UPI00341A56B1
MTLAILYACADEHDPSIAPGSPDEAKVPGPEVPAAKAADGANPEVAEPDRAAESGAGLGAEPGAEPGAGPVAGLSAGDAGWLAYDLAAALRAAGATAVDRVVVGEDLGAWLKETARRARNANVPLLLCADDLVAHHSLLWMLATDPGGRSAVLVAPDEHGDLHEERGRVTAAGMGTAGGVSAAASVAAGVGAAGDAGVDAGAARGAGAAGSVGGGAGAGTLRYLGAMCLAPADLPLLEKVAERPDLLAALLEEGLVPVALRVRLLHAERVRDSAQLAAARERLAAIDEDAARLRLAVKEQDDFFTTYAVSTWSPYVTKLAARLSLSPTAVTGLSVLFAGAAALLFWQASAFAMVGGAVLLYLGFVLDCVDGQLARYTRRFDAFGGWLDTMADRAKEYLVYAGLAAGADRLGLEYAWPLAITAITLQTVRHMTDTWYGALHDEAAARPRPQVAGGVGARLTAVSRMAQSRRGSAVYWGKRIVVFPIGERWALISVVAAVAGGRAALTAAVGFGVLAMLYTLTLRSLRARSMRVGVLNTVDTARHRDDGVLARFGLGRAGMDHPLIVTAVVVAYAMGGVISAEPLLTGMLAGGIPAVLAAGMTARARHDRALDWLVPAALRAVEYLFVIMAGLVGAVAPPVVFLLLLVLALRHYDLTARMEKGAPATGAKRAVLGWEGRTVLLLAATLAGWATAGMVTLIVLISGVFLVTAAGDWRATRKR